MNYYLLDPEMDVEFLNGKPVRCKMTIVLNQLHALKEGEPIVIQLSNRSKYKGRITCVNYRLNNGVAEGYFEVTRLIT
jgi:hypothetical protein